MFAERIVLFACKPGNGQAGLNLIHLNVHALRVCRDDCVKPLCDSSGCSNQFVVVVVIVVAVDLIVLVVVAGVVVWV